MTVLSIIQSHCKLHALGVPSSVIGSTDTQVIQLLEVLRECLQDMVTESKFQVTTQECVFTLSGGENQGPLSSLAGGLLGYYQANFETFYDRTLGHELYGPLSDTEWQTLKALPNPGPFYKFRIWQDQLYVNPEPTEPFSVISFEYMSSWAVKGADNMLKADISADNDVFVFPKNIVRKWMIFRWKQIKGLPYQADEQRAFDMLNNYIARDKVKRRINVSDQGQQLQPGIFVPAGNWMQ